jgi:hypothetical protein
MNPEMNDHYNAINPSNSVEERSAGFRAIIENDYAEKTKVSLSRRNGRFDDIYDGLENTHRFNTYDL